MLSESRPVGPRGRSQDYSNDSPIVFALKAEAGHEYEVNVVAPDPLQWDMWKLIVRDLSTNDDKIVHDQNIAVRKNTKLRFT